MAASMVEERVRFEDDKLVVLMAFYLAGWSDEYLAGKKVFEKETLRVV